MVPFLLWGFLFFLLFCACDFLEGSPTRTSRLLVAAVILGLYAAALSMVPALKKPPLIAAALLCGLLTAFGPSLRRMILTSLLCTGFCGLLLLYTLVLPVPASAVGSGAAAVDVKAAVLICGVLWGLCGLIPHKTLLPACATVGGQTVRFSCFRDTGNALRDPLSGHPVLLSDPTVAKKLLGVEEAALSSPVGLMAQLAETRPSLRCRLIPYSSVGMPSGLLFSVRCDRLTLGRKACPGALLAFSPTAVSDDGAYHGLTGGVSWN